MTLNLERLEVGPWPMNCYLIRCAATGEVAIVDPGADAPLILSAVGEATVRCILLTHGHPDHIGAVAEIRSITGAPLGVHLADAEAFDIEGDFPLVHGMEVQVGSGLVTVHHVPGHTAGSISLRIDGEVVVGDAIFPGGPGHTTSPEALALSLVSLGQTVFTWPDDTKLYPGHGPWTTVGAERDAFERFLQADHPAELCGEVSWH